MFYTVNEKNFEEKVLSFKGMVLVNFWTYWSDECRKMSSLMCNVNGFLDEEDAIMKVDWDQQKPLAQELRVFGVPTLLIFVCGREVTRYSGTIDKDDLIRRIMEAKSRFQSKGGVKKT